MPEDIEKITHPTEKKKTNKKSHWENLQEGWKNGTIRPPSNWKKRREEWDRTHNEDGSKKEEKIKEPKKTPENDSVDSVPDDVILEKEPPKEIIKEPVKEPEKEPQKEPPKEPEKEPPKENKVNIGKIFSNEYVLYGGIGLALVVGAIVFLKATKAKAPVVQAPAPKPRPEYEMVDIGMGRFVKRPIKYDD